MDIHLYELNKNKHMDQRYYRKKNQTRKYDGWDCNKSITNNHRRKRCRIRDQKNSDYIYVPKFNSKTHTWWDNKASDPNMNIKVWLDI